MHLLLKLLQVDSYVGAFLKDYGGPRLDVHRVKAMFKSEKEIVSFD